MTQPTCETCRFWKFWYDNDGLRIGICRRHAPATGWPKTWCDHWCGEHELRADEWVSKQPHIAKLNP